MLQTWPSYCLFSKSDHRKCFYPFINYFTWLRNNFFAKDEQIYGIPNLIWQQIGIETLTTNTKLGIIHLTESQQWSFDQSLWNTNDKMWFNQFLRYVHFQYRGFHHLELHCILIIEAWLNLNINFDCRYLELWTACIFSLHFIVLKVRNKIDCKYPSIVFLSIYWFYCVY